MNWLDNICNKHNCRKDGECPHGTYCCYEKDEKTGNTGKVGSCVKKDSCNFKTGVPTNKPTAECPNYIEGYDGPDSNCDNCNKWKWAAMSVLIFVALIFGFLWIYLKYKNSF